MTSKYLTERSSTIITKMDFLGPLRRGLRRFGLVSGHDGQEEVNQGGSNKRCSSRETCSPHSMSTSATGSQAPSPTGSRKTQPVFTEGPCKVVTASDGKADCLALLLTRDTVNHINEMMEIKTRVNAMKAKMKGHEEELEYAEKIIEAIEEMLEGQDESRMDESYVTRLAETEKTRDKEKREIERLTPDLKIGIRGEESTRDRYLREVCSALEEANLMKPAEDEETDEAASVHSQEEPVSEKTESSVVTPEELNRRTAMEDVHFWDNELYAAQEDFDGRFDWYHNELNEYNDAVAAGRTSWTQTDFDHHYFVEVQRKTRRLIYAEESYRDAKKYAREVPGALPDENEFEQESDFFDHPDDGYRESLEASWVAAAPHDRIENWLDGIIQGTSHDPLASLLESGDPPSEQFEQETKDVDDWDLRSVSFASSIGVLDHGPNRRNIERWREICESRRMERARHDEADH